MNTSSLPSIPLHIVLLGYGNVAKALLPLLASRREWLQQELGIHSVMSGIGTRSNGFYIHPHGIDVAILAQERHPFTSFIQQSKKVVDAYSFLHDAKAVGASLLIELTTLHPTDGEPALTHIRTALQSGMDVITANKGPVAYAQAELLAVAKQHGVQFRFESTVMDGLPLINLSQFTLSAVGIHSFRALLNTTSSLILSRIEQGSTLEEAISEAQRLGIAEADPWYDLDGWDAAMKTTILANTLLEGNLTPDKVQRQGIRNLSMETIREAAVSGSPIRLVSQASRKDGNIVAEVRPLRLAKDDILQNRKSTTSSISLETEAMGTITLVEHEPLVLQTAYGVLSDLITIMKQKLSQA